MIRTLPPNPDSCVTLTDVESARLKSLYPALWADPHKECITCNKAGFFLWRDPETGQPVEYQCDCVAQWKLHRYLTNAGIGTSYQRLCWDDAQGVPAPIQLAVLEYAHNAARNVSQGRSMILWSEGAGTGKTLLSSLVAKRMLAEGFDTYFTQFNEMLDFFTGGWRDADERAWFIRRVRNVPVLVIDDVGKENKNRAEVVFSMFDTVMRARVADARPTIITTNFTPEKMRSYGKFLSSLLTENFWTYEVTGPDYRTLVTKRIIEENKLGLTRPVMVG